MRLLRLRAEAAEWRQTSSDKQLRIKIDLNVFSCFVVKATFGKPSELSCSMCNVLYWAKKNRKRLFETFHKMLYPFKELQSVIVIQFRFITFFLVSMNCGYKVIKYKVDS